MTENLLEIVDENDVVVGTEPREKIHRNGLLHREIHVWFVTPEGNVILQHRAKDKDSYPDLFDATVGGHVEIGQSYEEAALQETKEETGVELNASNLVFLEKIRTRSEDSLTGSINNTFKKEYAYIYRGTVSDLRIEAGKAIGFEAWPLNTMLALTDEQKARIIPFFTTLEYLPIFQKIKELI